MTSRATTRSRIRVLAAATTIAGTVLVLRPVRSAGWVSQPGRTPDRRIVRVLGGRQVLQGAVQIVRPNATTVTAGALVDALHAASMLMLAAVWPSYRAPALASAAMAGFSAGAGLAIRLADS